MSKKITLAFLILAIGFATCGCWLFFSNTRELVEDNVAKSQKIEMLEKQIEHCK